MVRSQRFNPLLLAPLLLAVACGDGSSRIPETSAGSDLGRVEGWLSPGENLQLAAALSAADPQRPGGPGASWPSLSLEVQAELTHTADAIVRFLAFECGAGVDPVWSPFVARLAEEDNAPKDGDGGGTKNGTNRDEALAHFRERYVFRTNAPVPVDLAPSFVLPARLPPRIIGRPVSRGDSRNLRLPPAPEANLAFTPGDLGLAILAWTRRAASLLGGGRGDLYGRSGPEGIRGLLLLEQALAAERFVLESLAFDGGALGRIADPANYDPEKSAKLFPAAVRYRRESVHATLPPQAEPFVVDRGSSLLDQARLLRGFAELAWLASENQTHPLLRRLFEGDPFGQGPGAPQRAARAGHGGSAGTSSLVTWEQNIKGLLQSSCSGVGCHFPGATSGYSVKDYASTLRGGGRGPAVVKDRSRESLLWQITTAAQPGLARMPLGGPYLEVPATDLIAEWIDGGALEKDPGGGNVVPMAGKDGVLVVLRNLRAMHLEKVSGALVDRADLKGRGDLVMADSAGEVLQALAAVVTAAPDVTEARPLLESHALFVAAKLVAADGQVRESFLLAPEEPAPAAASLGAAACVVAGLFEAWRVFGRDEIKAAGERAADFLAREYLFGRSEIASFPSSPAARLTPADMAHVLEAAAAWSDVTGDSRARGVILKVFELSKRFGLLLAEWPETGEPLGDGNRDTDADRVPEVGTDGLPPLFAAALENSFLTRGVGVPVRRVHYSRDLLPVFLEQCRQCHAGGAKRGDFQLDTYDDLFRGGDFREKMRTAVPGKPEESLLWRKVQDRPPPFGGQMPEGGPPLTPASRALIRLWIEQGAVRD